MDSLGNILRMLFLLKRNKKMKIKDLSKELNVSERQVKRYKNELEKYFKITSITGSDGGYIIEDQYFAFKSVLTESDINKLRLFANYLNDESNMNFEEILKKLNLNITDYDNSNEIESIIYYSKPNSEIINEDMQKNYFNISNAIKNKNEMIIEYQGNNGKISKRRVQPYKLFVYKGEYYLVAMCLLRNDVRYFKLVRIRNLIITGINFNSDFDIDKFLKKEKENNMGIYGGKLIDLEIYVVPPMANTIKERIWVKNQEIIELEDGSINFKAKIKEGPELISWILSMGECVKIISPNSLKEEINKKIKIMIKNFSIED